MTASNSLLRFLGKRPLRSFDEEDLLELALQIEAEVCRRRLIDLEGDSGEPFDARSQECSAMYDVVFPQLAQSGSPVPEDMQTGQLRQGSQGE